MRIEHLRPLFVSLDSHKVEYLVIGGVAAIIHGVPRLTFDLDLAIRPTRGNAETLLAAFLDVGFGTAALTDPDDLLAHQVTLFDDRIAIDVQTRTSGLDFHAAYARRVTLDARGVPVQVVSVPDLIAMKEAAGRPQDLEDVRILKLAAG